MKVDIFKALALKNHLIKRMDFVCGNALDECPFHKFL